MLLITLSPSAISVYWLLWLQVPQIWSPGLQLRLTPKKSQADDDNTPEMSLAMWQWGMNPWKGLAFWESRALTAHPSCIAWCVLLCSLNFFSNCSLYREQRGKCSSAQAKASQFKQTGRGYFWEPGARMHRRKMQLWRSPRSIWKHRENCEYLCCKMATPFSPQPTLAWTVQARHRGRRRSKEQGGKGQEPGVASITPWFSVMIHLLGWGKALEAWSLPRLLKQLFSFKIFALALESSLYYSSPGIRNWVKFYFFLLCRWSFGRLTLVRAAFFMFTCIIFISQCISSRCLLKCVSEFQNCFITELVRVISPKCCSHPACACLICTQITRKKKLLSIFYVKQGFCFVLFFKQTAQTSQNKTSLHEVLDPTSPAHILGF